LLFALLALRNDALPFGPTRDARAFSQCAARVWRVIHLNCSVEMAVAVDCNSSTICISIHATDVCVSTDSQGNIWRTIFFKLNIWRTLKYQLPK